MIKTLLLRTIIWIAVIFLLLYIYNRVEISKAEQAFPPEGKFVTVENVTLHYVIRGSGKPVVFLHGNLGTMNDFLTSPTIPLAEKKYECIVFDRPGHGYSSKTNETPYPWIQARVFHEALKKLGIEKPVIVAHSWGASIALSYALDYPDNISGLVLLGPVLYKWPNPVDKLFYITTIPFFGKLFTETLLIPIGRVIAPRILKTIASPASVPERFVHISQGFALRPSQFETDSEEMRILKDSLFMLSPRYPTLKLPIYILAGNNDKSVNTNFHSVRFVKEVPQAVLERLSDVGHAIHFGKPAEIVDAIDKAYERH